MPDPQPSTALRHYLELRGADVLLRVRVQPRSGHEGAGGLHGARLKVRVGAPPADGRANERLRELISRHVAETDSRYAAMLLHNWDQTLGDFWQVVPKDYVKYLPHALSDEQEQARA